MTTKVLATLRHWEMLEMTQSNSTPAPVPAQPISPPMTPDHVEGADSMWGDLS